MWDKIILYRAGQDNIIQSESTCCVQSSIHRASFKLFAIPFNKVPGGGLKGGWLQSRRWGGNGGLAAIAVWDKIWDKILMYRMSQLDEDGFSSVSGTRS